MFIETQLDDYSSLAKRFVEFICAELSIEPKRVTVAECKLVNGIVGVCLDDDEGEFTILIDKSDRDVVEVFTTIAHEMIHVKQYMNENLGWFLDNRMDIPYLERWWEKEAFGNSIPLVEKFAEVIK